MNRLPLWLQEPVLHPFILPVWMCIAFVSSAKAFILPEYLLGTIVFIELLVGVLLAICWLIKRNIRAAGILCSASIIYCLSYRLVKLGIVDLPWCIATGHVAPDWVSLSVFTLIGLKIIPSLLKTEWRFGRHLYTLDQAILNRSLNIITFSFLCINLMPIALYNYQEIKLAKHFIKKFQQPFVHLNLVSNAPKPDIYYIILDGFASHEVLKRLWNFNDSTLVNYLEKKGFYVVPNARSNYDRTELSLASSLNMQYIDSIPDELGKDEHHDQLFDRLINNNAVAFLLKKNGYTFIKISDSPRDFLSAANEYSEYNYCSYFAVELALLTPLYSLEEYVPLLRNIVAYHMLSPGNLLINLPLKPGPKFVLLHSELSHAPCLFDENGNMSALTKYKYNRDWGTPAQYFAQWKYTEKQAITWVEHILNQPGPKPIIIIQSDHGPGIVCEKFSYWHEERMHILNAYYFPKYNGQGLYSSITPVNTFRLMLNNYFQAALPLLPDKVYCAKNLPLPDLAPPFYWKDLPSDELKK